MRSPSLRSVAGVHFAGVAQGGQLGLADGGTGSAGRERPQRAAAGPRRSGRRARFAQNGSSGMKADHLGGRRVDKQRSRKRCGRPWADSQWHRACGRLRLQHRIDLGGSRGEARLQLAHRLGCLQHAAALACVIGLPQVRPRAQLQRRPGPPSSRRSFPAASRKGRTASSVGPDQGMASTPAGCAPSSSSGTSTACTTRKRSISNTRCTGRATATVHSAVAQRRQLEQRHHREVAPQFRPAACARLKTAKVIRGPRITSTVDDQEEQLAPAGNLPVRVGIPEAEDQQRRSAATARLSRGGCRRPAAVLSS